MRAQTTQTLRLAGRPTTLRRRHQRGPPGPRSPASPQPGAGSAVTSRGQARLLSPRGCKLLSDSCSLASVWGAVSSAPWPRGLGFLPLYQIGPGCRAVKAPPASFPPSCVERTRSGRSTQRHLRCCTRRRGPGAGAGAGPPLPEPRLPHTTRSHPFILEGERDFVLSSARPRALASTRGAPGSCRP